MVTFSMLVPMLETPSERLPKLLTFEELGQVRVKNPGKKILHCHGVFDVLHAGHLAYFDSAKKLGDILVVTITADKFVNKGPGRPYFSAPIRARMLAALESVNFVAVNQSPTAVPAIEKLRPDFYVKGPDYRVKDKDPTGAIYDEEKAVEKFGGRLVFTDDETFSSSTLINQFFSQWSEDQLTTIKSVRSNGGLDRVLEILGRVQEERLLVLGEPIVDTYVFCRPESISSKSPSISAKWLYEENYAGGSLAIANHLADFVKDIRLLITHGDEPYFRQVLKSKVDRRVQILAEKLPGVPTPRKTRFISEDKAQRIFEITDLRSDQWLLHTPENFIKLLQEQDCNRSCLIAADFGHGLFEGQVLQALSTTSGFLALNVQTNSSNFGFNPFTKHKRFSYLSLDTKEVRVAFHDRFSAPMDLARRLSSDSRMNGMAVAMTLGSQGSYYFPGGGEPEVFSPAFTDTVIDTTGAGDAFFGFSSLLVKVGCPPSFVPFLGNIFAGLKTKIIGNKSSVNSAQFIKAVTAVLK